MKLTPERLADLKRWAHYQCHDSPMSPRALRQAMQDAVAHIEALEAENAELREILLDTPMIGSMCAHTVHFVGDEMSRKGKHITEWLARRSTALSPTPQPCHQRP